MIGPGKSMEETVQSLLHRAMAINSPKNFSRISFSGSHSLSQSLDKADRKASSRHDRRPGAGGRLVRSPSP